MRLYLEQYADEASTGECLTGHPFTVPKVPSDGQQVGDERTEPVFKFSDAMSYPQRSPWEKLGSLVPEIRPDRLSIPMRIILILAGTFALAVSALLIVAIAQGLDGLL